MKNPEISVIIPVYNGERTLGKCLRSVLDQSYKNYEVILVDNNSTDGTKRIIERFQSENMNLKYVFESEKGRGAARNTGIRNAKGSIIAMTDSDCIVPFDWLGEITEPIRKNKELIVQGAELDYIGNFWTEMQQEFNKKFVDGAVYGMYVDHLDTKNFAIKKEILLKLGMFNALIGNLEDFELKVRVKKRKYKIFFNPECKVSHVHRESFSKLFLRRIDRGYWATRIYLLHSRFFKKNPEEMVKSMNVVYFFAFFPWIVFYSLKNEAKHSLFEFVTGVAWRVGVLWAIIFK